MAWSRTDCQHSRMTMPSSLLMSWKLVRVDAQSLFDEQYGRLVQHTGFLPQYWVMLSPCVLFYGQLLSLPIWQQLCAPLCGCRGLPLSPIYIHGRNLVHNSSRSWFLILISCLWRVDANQNSKSKIILPNPFNSTPSALVYIVNVPFVVIILQT